MNALAGAAVTAFSSLDSPARVSSNEALRLSPRSSSSRACRFKSCRRRGIAEAGAGSFSNDPDDGEAEPGCGNAGAEGPQFSSISNVTRKFTGEKFDSEARVFGASHLWAPQRQHARGVQSFDRHQARGSLASEGAIAYRNNDSDIAMAHDGGHDTIPYGEQQHHASFVGRKVPRVPLPTKNQHLRMHNKVSAFKSVRQPYLSGHFLNDDTDASSWGVEDKDIAPNFNREANEDSGHRLKYSRLNTQNENKDNIQKGKKFMSKLQEVLSSLKKKDDLSRDNLIMNQKVLRDESSFTHGGQGLQSATSEGKKVENSRVLRSPETSEKGSAKSIDSHIESSARYAHRTSAREYLRQLSLMSHGKQLESKHGEARSLLEENTSISCEAGVTTLNLFSSSPAVPWEADRKYESALKPSLPIRRGKISPLARRAFRSIGSRSSPSQSSGNSRNAYHSKLDSHAAMTVMDPSKLIGEAKQVELRFGEGTVLNSDKSTTQITSLKGALKGDTPVESVNLDCIEMNAEDSALSVHQSTTENTTKAYVPINSSLSALSPHGDSDFNEEKDVLSGSDMGDIVPPEIDSLKRPHHKKKNIVDSRHHNKKNSVDSCNSDVVDAEPPVYDSSETSLHNKEEALSTLMTHTNAAPEEFLDKMALEASEKSNGSKDSSSATWHKHNFPDLPFDFQFSYTETPKVPILGYREIPYSPFGPSTMGRPWTGDPPHKPSKKKKWAFDSFKPPPKDKEGVKHVEDPGPYPEGQGPKPAKSREALLGEPLTKEEVTYLVEKCERENRQLNLGRDGLTHNMLESIHCHWKRRRVCKIKCKGVPTLDMDNVKFHIEEKTQGKIIYQAGGVLYLFRGRNYNYKDRPQIPLMHWKPATPIYPKLIQPAPEGLTKEEAQSLRAFGQKVQPMCRIGKNGVYLNLVKDVRAAFKVDELVRIDCQGLYPRDYKKIGAKLKDLVPCVLLSFDKDSILLWKGKENPYMKDNSLSRPPTLETHHASEDIFKQSSSIPNEGNDQSTYEEKLDISADEASYSIHVSEGETQEKMQQSSSERELGSTLDYAFQKLTTHSCDAEATSELDIVKHHMEAQSADIDHQTSFSYSTKDGDLALTGTGRTNYASNAQLPNEETGKVSAEKVNVSLRINPLLGDEICVQSSDSLSERQDDMDRKLQQNTGSAGLHPAFEEVTNSVVSKLGEDGQEEPVQVEAGDEVEDGLVRDKEEINEWLDNQTDDDVVRLDELWEHASSSGMAIKLPEEGMDADLIVQEAAQLAKLAPLGPTYTIKLRHRLQIKHYVQRPDDFLYISFRRGKPRRVPKKRVRRKAPLPTLDVPGMGGLPVDELAMLLAPQQAP